MSRAGRHRDPRFQYCNATLAQRRSNRDADRADRADGAESVPTQRWWRRAMVVKKRERPGLGKPVDPEVVPPSIRPLA
jgi:hypothetical protein